MRGRGAVNSDEFIREVDEAVRQDRWLQLAKQYGSYLITGALAIVLGTAAGVGWRTYQHNQRLEDARRYAAAEQLLRQNHPDQASAAFLALAKDAGGGYGIVARLRAAEAQAKAGDQAAAQQALSGLAEDAQAAPEYRQLGDLLAVQRDFDALDPADLSRRLASLTGPAGPWRHSALELEALAQLRAGQTEAARRTLMDLLADPGTPPDLGRRAAELLASLGGPIEPAAKTAAEDATVEDAPAQGSQ